jgi:hypothetical protein
MAKAWLASSVVLEAHYVGLRERLCAATETGEAVTAKI